MSAKLGQPAPDFELLDIHEQAHRLMTYRGRIVVLNFWSAECPWSEKADAEIRKYSEAWGEMVIVLSIASNQNEDAEFIASRSFFPILMDSGAYVAGLFDAQTTPHVFVIDVGGILRYRGALNDVTFRQRVAQHFYLKDAVDALLRGDFPQINETNPYGCAIVREI